MQEGLWRPHRGPVCSAPRLLGKFPDLVGPNREDGVTPI